MVKIKNYKIDIKNKVGDVFSESCPSFVSDQGEFSIQIPEILVDLAKQNAVDNTYCVSVSRAKTFWRVYGIELKRCQLYIDKLATAYINVEHTVETVIRYTHDAQVSYVKSSLTSNEEVFANAYDYNTATGGSSEDVRWARSGGLHATNCTNCYRVGLAAVVVDKHVYKRGLSTTVEYDRPKAFANHSCKLYGERLNMFVGLSIETHHDTFHGLSTERSGGVEEMPYTEEAAQFFYEGMITLCRLADLVSQTLGSKETINRLISQGSGFSLQHIQ
jgi:hypothetical protein